MDKLEPSLFLVPITPDRSVPVSLIVIFSFQRPAQIERAFAFNDLLDKPWSQVASLLPRGACLILYNT